MCFSKQSNTTYQLESNKSIRTKGKQINWTTSKLKLFLETRKDHVRTIRKWPTMPPASQKSAHQKWITNTLNLGFYSSEVQKNEFLVFSPFSMVFCYGSPTSYSIYLKEPEAGSWGGICTPTFNQCIIIHNSQGTEANQCPLTGEGIKTMWHAMWMMKCGILVLGHLMYINVGIRSYEKYCGMGLKCVMVTHYTCWRWECDTHTMEYYLALKTKEILTYPTT